ncbi:MAG: hypothetical protein KAG89_07685 [Fulvimarina manganoxydans]|uniref:hypothetical protein n=1 Tax=Fulvimarina manganoxydans TaxID=937218 RepID=UPI00235256EA|nr:hypothetical protein [Fulvimarina manganoxydans]MCK5932041.1 hypothetical protein [Fulvimarina manganoxydans]
MIRALIFTLLLVPLTACGGMNRAVGVLPNTLDDLGRQSAALRGERVEGEARATTGRPSPSR